MLLLFPEYIKKVIIVSNITQYIKKIFTNIEKKNLMHWKRNSNGRKWKLWCFIVIIIFILFFWCLSSVVKSECVKKLKNGQFPTTRIITNENKFAAIRGYFKKIRKYIFFIQLLLQKKVITMWYNFNKPTGLFLCFNTFIGKHAQIYRENHI